MQLPLLITDRFGLTGQRFLDDLPQAREIEGLEGPQLQPSTFALTRVPVDRELNEPFWPLCYGCGRPVQQRIGWVCYDDGRTYHAGCDEQG